MIDIQVPPSELEIAEVINDVTFLQAGVVRRLAFQRDVMKANLYRANTDIGKLLRILHTLWLDVKQGDGNFDPSTMSDCEKLFAYKPKEERIDWQSLYSELEDL